MLAPAVPPAGRRVRRRVRGQVFMAGVLIAILLTVPFVNLVAPIIATAAMVHLLHGWRERLEPAEQGPELENHSLEVRD